MDIGKVGLKAGQFIVRNGRRIGTLLAYAAAAALVDRYGVTLRLNETRNYADIPSYHFPPRNVNEAAIESIRENAQSMYSDADRLNAANNIVSIASKHGVDDATKTYAINALNEIADDMFTNTSKRDILEYILKIAQN